jgi:hypothetical protein
VPQLTPYAAVAADYKEVKEMQDTSHSTSRSQRFNTAHHTPEDILPVIHKTVNFKHDRLPWTAYGYVVWQPLIAHFQNLKDSRDIQTPSFLLENPMRCRAAWSQPTSFLRSY